MASSSDHLGGTQPKRPISDVADVEDNSDKDEDEDLQITDNEEDMDEGEDPDVPETAWAWMVIDEDDLDPFMLVAVPE